MKTPWGDIEISDAHVHFFSDSFFQLLAKQKDGLTVESMAPLLGWEMPPADPVALGARWVDELDRHHVSRVALIASLPGDEASVEAAVAAYPDRFYGYFMVNPLAPHAAERVRQLLEGGRMSVPCLFPAMHRYPLHDPAVNALLEAMSDLPAPVVFVHCGVLSVGIRKKLGLPSPFDLRFSNPVDLHGLALRYPRIRFIIPHFGAGYFREALMVAGLCPNIYLDTSSSNSWMRFVPGLTLETVFRSALDVAGAGRLLFGTDSSFFPRGWQKPVFASQLEALISLGVGDEEAKAIFGGNLRKLLED
jgi:predicted TIM-barrel fold metal-dependent hydrolase